MILTGQPIAANFRPRRTWNKKTGWNTTRMLRGVDAEVEQWVEQLQQQGYTDIEIIPDQDTPFSTLNYSVGHADDGSAAETQVVDLWSLVGNDLEKTLWQHPKVTAITSQMTDKGLANFRSDFNAALAINRSPDEVPFAKIPLVGDTLRAFYREVLSGVEVFPVSQYVLKRTLTVNDGTNLRPGQANVGKIFTSAQLEQSENIPQTILFTLPDGFWLKRTPSVEPMTNGKWQFSQEWWNADSYSTFVFDGANV